MKLRTPVNGEKAGNGNFNPFNDRIFHRHLGGRLARMHEFVKTEFNEMDRRIATHQLKPLTAGEQAAETRPVSCFVQRRETVRTAPHKSTIAACTPNAVRPAKTASPHPAIPTPVPWKTIILA